MDNKKAAPRDSQLEWRTTLVAILHLIQSYAQDMLDVNMGQNYEDVYWELMAVHDKMDRALEVFANTRAL